MHPIAVIFLSIVGVCVFGSCIGAGIRRYDILHGFVVVGLMVLLFGNGVICGALPLGQPSITVLIPTDMAKTKTMTIAQYDNMVVSDESVKIYEALPESIRIKRQEQTNLYGGKLGKISYCLTIIEDGLEKIDN